MAKKEPLNMGCEASSEVETWAGAPVVILCGKPGKIRDDVKVLKFSTILCDECYAAHKKPLGKDPVQ